MILQELLALLENEEYDGPPLMIDGEEVSADVYLDNMMNHVMINMPEDYHLGVLRFDDFDGWVITGDAHYEDQASFEYGSDEDGDDYDAEEKPDLDISVPVTGNYTEDETAVMAAFHNAAE